MLDKPIIDCDVAIVGGGIAGPALAAALADSEYRVLLVERSADPLDTARGDHLQPASCEWLARWNLLDLMYARGAERRCGAQWRTPDGTPILNAAVDELDIPYPYFLYLNHELISEAFLERAASNSAFTTMRPASARIERDGISAGQHAVLVNHDGGQTRIHAACVAIADGRASLGRKAIGIGARIHNYENPLLVLFTPRSFEDERNDAHIFLTRAGVISVVPRIQGEWKIGFPLSRSAIGEWTNLSPNELGRRLTDLVPKLEGIRPRLGGVYPVAMVNADRWVDGNCVLLGDACHALHPGRSQGMNVALRSVAALAKQLSDCRRIEDADAITALLAEFEARHKAPIDERLEANHARGLEMDRLDAETIERMKLGLEAVAESAESTHRYCMRAAGY